MTVAADTAVLPPAPDPLDTAFDLKEAGLEIALGATIAPVLIALADHLIARHPEAKPLRAAILDELRGAFALGFSYTDGARSTAARMAVGAEEYSERHDMPLSLVAELLFEGLIAGNAATARNGA